MSSANHWLPGGEFYKGKPLIMAAKGVGVMGSITWLGPGLGIRS